MYSSRKDDNFEMLRETQNDVSHSESDSYFVGDELRLTRLSVFFVTVLWIIKKFGKFLRQKSPSTAKYVLSPFSLLWILPRLIVSFLRRQRMKMMMIPVKHVKEGESTHTRTNNMKNIRTRFTRNKRKNHLSKSDMKSQNRVKVFPTFFRCFCWCHGNMNFTLIISDTRAYDFQNEIANSQKKVKLLKKFSSIQVTSRSRPRTTTMKKKFQVECRCVGNDNAMKKITNAVMRQ